MVACQNQKDMWRCGESEYFNGYRAEDPEIDSNGDPVYLRDFFPGTLFYVASTSQCNKWQIGLYYVHPTEKIDDIELLHSSY